MSSRNLKEHYSFYKWIKHYGACLDEQNEKIKRLKERVDSMEARLDSLLEYMERKE